MARWAFRVAGACGNCGSYEITPIAPAVVGGRTEGRRLPGAAAHAPAH
jgi:hypothetical protein